MENGKLSAGQINVAATGFVSLFSLAGIFYGLPFLYNFWFKEYRWSRAAITSGNAFAKIFAGLFDVVAGWLTDRYSLRRLLLAGILMNGVAALVVFAVIGIIATVLLPRKKMTE